MSVHQYTRSMVDNNPTASLARAYREMHPMQYLREMYYNAVEAGATAAYIRPVNNIKMAFCDDGHGMNPEDLLRLINGRNSSSKSTDGFHGNFGVGLKDSALTPNPYGLVIASKTETKRHGGMIWLHQKDGVSGAKMLISDEMRRDFCYTPDHFEDFTAQYGDELYSIDFEWIRNEFGYNSFTICGVDWMRIFKDCRANTIVTMMGESADDVTFDSRGFKISSFMCSKLYTAPIRMMVPSTRKRNSIGVEWIKLQTVSGLKYPSYTKLFKDFKITTWIKPADRGPDKRQPINSLRSFMSAVRYKDELFNYVHDPSGAGRSRAQTAAKRWGLYYPKVFNRVIIIVEPPQYDADTAIGCFPNSTRQELLWSDPRENIDSGKIDVPLREIQDWYISNMPNELRELIQEEVQKTLEQVKKSKKISQFRKFFKAPKVEKAGNATADGDLFINPLGEESADQSSAMDKLFEGRESSAKVRTDNESKDSQESKDRSQREGKDGDSSPADRRERRPSPKDASVLFTSPGDEVWPTYEALARSDKGGLFPFVYTGIRRGDNVNVVYVNREAPIIEALIRSALDWVSRRGAAKLPMTDAECFKYLVSPFIEDFMPVTLAHLNGDRDRLKLGLTVTDPVLLYAVFHGTWQIHYNLHEYYDEFRKLVNSPSVEVH